MSHAFSYSVLTVITAWLKVHYPVEFYTSNIIHNVGNPEKISDFIEEAKYFNINVKVPDINESYHTFHIIDDYTIIFGFDAVQKVGKKAAKQIIKERKQNGPFKGLFDFITRMLDKGIKTNVVKNLILAGAFSKFGFRKVLHDRVDELFLYARDADKYNIGIDQELASYVGDREEYDKLTLMRLERDILGINVTGNPLKYIIDNYKGDMDVAFLREHLGVITNVKTTKTRKGDLMAFANVLKADGTEVRLVIFPRVYNRYVRNLERGKIIIFNGKSEDGGYIVNSITDAQSIVDETERHTEVMFDSVEKLYKRLDDVGNDPAIQRVKVRLKHNRILIMERDMYGDFRAR